MRAGKLAAVALPFAASLASACAQSGNGVPTPGWAGDASTSDTGGNPATTGGTDGGDSDAGDEAGADADDHDTGGLPIGDASAVDGSDSGTCLAGQPCTSPNPCTMGVTGCSTGTPVCNSGANLPNGTACGTNEVCGNGTCNACTQGAACTPTNACHTGTTDCSTGSPVCTDTGTSLANGTSCGASGVCESGACNACGAQGQYCCAGNTCSASPQLCIGAVASTCRTNVSPQCTCGTLYQGMQLQVGQQLDSCDGRFDLILQSDGNLVLYEGTTALWASNTVGSGAALATMQDDGNFVVYTSGGTAVFNTATEGSGCGTYLAVQTDGNLVVYNGAGTALWSSGTGGH